MNQTHQPPSAEAWQAFVARSDGTLDGVVRNGGTQERILAAERAGLGAFGQALMGSRQAGV